LLCDQACQEHFTVIVGQFNVGVFLMRADFRCASATGYCLAKRNCHSLQRAEISLASLRVYEHQVGGWELMDMQGDGANGILMPVNEAGENETTGLLEVC
jgi:hypothetical protein